MKKERKFAVFILTAGVFLNSCDADAAWRRVNILREEREKLLHSPQPKANRIGSRQSLRGGFLFNNLIDVFSSVF